MLSNVKQLAIDSMSAKIKSGYVSCGMHVSGPTDFRQLLQYGNLKSRGDGQVSG